MRAKLAHATDLHLDDFLSAHYGVDARRSAVRVLDDIVARGIRAVALTGDIGEPGSLGWLVGELERRGLDYRFALGNHDAAADFAALPRMAGTARADGLYYEAVLAGAPCLFLDSSSGSLGPAQAEWLGVRLAAAPSPALVFCHHPVLDCGGTAMDRLYPLKDRDAVREVLLGCGAEVRLFCGHYHTAHEQRLGNIVQCVTRSSALQIKRGGNAVDRAPDGFGYRIVAVDGTEISSEDVSIQPL